MTDPIRVAVVGVGHLGRHHARILAGMPGVELVGVADTCQSRVQEVARQCGVAAYQDFRPLLPQVTTAVIAVPTSRHFEVASAFLAAGKPVLVEKPLSADVTQANRLVQLANDNRCALVVGHIERFNPVLGALPDRPDPPRLIEAKRIGPYSFRSRDIGVVFDLMIHDLDIVLSLLRESPETVQAWAWNIFGGHEDVATAQLTFACGTVARLTASRADSISRREMTIWWGDSVAHLDFANKRTVTTIATEEFHRVRGRFRQANSRELAALQKRFQDGKYFSVTEQQWIADRDQLTQELEEFLHCVRTGAEPRIDGPQARDAVHAASAILLAASGQPSVRVAA